MSVVGGLGRDVSCAVVGCTDSGIVAEWLLGGGVVLLVVLVGVFMAIRQRR